MRTSLSIFCAAAAATLGIAAGASPQAQSPAAAVQSRTPTFSRDVAPIVFANCVTCHRPGELAPFSLLTYGDARQHATQIAAVTKSRFMPPWKPEHGDIAFAGERRLTDAQIQTLDRWAQAGAPEGNASDLPKPPVFDSAWHLGTPDLVVTMPDALDVPAAGVDVFRNVVLKVPLTKQRFVQAVEFHPGNARVLHHARILVDETDASHWRDLDDPGPGFGGMDAPEAHFPDGHFIGWAPGKLASKESLPWPMAAGTDFVVQMHLRPTGKPERIQASIGLYFSDTPPSAAPVMLRLGSRAIDIPAGTASYQIDDAYTLPVDVDVLRVYPHAHYLGRSISLTAKLPDGSARDLLRITDWDFNWQDEYQYASPVALPKGTIVSTKYVFDNSAANPRNPHHPPVRVRFGPDATDEMCELLLQVVPKDAASFAVLRSDVTKRTLLADIAGDEKRVADNPDDPQAHDALGVEYFHVGRVDDAVKELNATLRIKPDHAVANFNISLIEMTQGRFDAAVAHLRKAIAVRPDYAEAHNNLGILLTRQGSTDAAAAEFRDVLRIHPDSSDAHYNLGRILLGTGRTAEAIGHFRAAILTKPDVPSMLDDLSWILSTSPDPKIRNPKEAITLAEHAAALTGRRNPSVLDTLGAAYAADGHFEQAAQAARAAFDLASDANALDEAGEFLKRLDLYRKGQPYVEDVK
jgi:tetratricopeptide (TPR) repeat protein/mono/diheme cytochrome c family protein